MSTKASWSGGGGLAVLVHGGAGMRGAEVEPTSGPIAAAARAYEVLKRGGSALDAVEAAVVAMEDDPRYNAGTGAALTETGDVELDASIMEGRTLRAGAVCTLRGYANAVRVARAALEDGRHVFYSGEGARTVARKAGLTEVDPASLVTERQKERLRRFLADARATEGGNTVGAVAFDSSGSVAAATSTGGITGKRAGRIGDSPVIGAGTHADDECGAASATGPGEAILRISLTFRATARLGRGIAAEEAARAALAELEDRVGGSGGIILVDRRGALGLARTTEAMPWAARWDGGEDSGV